MSEASKILVITIFQHSFLSVLHSYIKTKCIVLLTVGKHFNAVESYVPVLLLT